MTPISRRKLLTAGPMALAACRPAQGYFGRTAPPDSQRLVYLIGAEPATLDPAKSADLWELYIVHALFEGLTTSHPVTCEPMAGLATHYQVSADGLRYTFFLRGHAAAIGVRLPNTSDLAPEFSRRRPAPPDTQVARWSDGAIITAHDLVYSWRRAVAPETAANYAFQLLCIQHAQEVTAGKRRPDELAVRALDAFTLRVDLREPVPFFLQLASNRVFCAVPRQAIEAGERDWTEPGRLVSSGAFQLRHRRAGEEIILSRNPHYYESGIVSLGELAFLPVTDGVANVNLYKTGDAALIQTYIPSLMPFLSRKKDFRAYPSFGTVFQVLNSNRPPLDDVRVRYALNMGTDKRAIADFMGVGRKPALGLVPPVTGYDAPESLLVNIDGADCDVLAFNPRAARELLVKAIGSRRLQLEFLNPNLPEARLVPQVFRQQWRENLGIELILVTQEVQTWIQSIYSHNYTVAGCADYGGYLDPTWFLDSFTSQSTANTTPWTDPRYDEMLAGARSTTDRGERLRKLAGCERHLLRAMPVLPTYGDVWVYMRKPFVRGFGTNMMDRQQFKYTWIDRNWSAA